MLAVATLDVISVMAAVRMQMTTTMAQSGRPASTVSWEPAQSESPDRCKQRGETRGDRN